MSTDQKKDTENTSSDSNEKSDKNSTNMVDSSGSSLCPVTPYSNKESANSTSKLKSPSTLSSSPMKKDDNCPSTSTPVEDVFDSFAPGPNHFKHVEKPDSHVARRLKYDSGDNNCVSEAEFESVYESILEDIIYKQAEDVLAKIMCPTDVFMTPPGARLAGIADTCPGAPLKPVKKSSSRNVDMKLCRKLEF